ncbi:DNA-binding transcriptional LysR family regulator [Pseudoduganella flava]|uniref:DNA-binding transcriptional LysR family regulator n=1 Tax=Pseudoduganella flava TaxID=871742 RepID=A0A562PEG4_9BURK|nr:LysR family transcriptional regulator [Pseudoduganella flava]QGZ42962.1 LysR family transcriptional regulator [Pseudoduganella flava]TWI42824.1 DNA-binding transcriptional LysR family regulator [Pseudoduganella flava]
MVLLAQLGSLSAAARELGVTPPAATRRLAQMEERLGVRLANRSTRRVSLTSEGELYLAQATQILADIRAMEDSVRSSRAVPKGLLRVNATLGFGRTSIAPLVSRFARKYPEVEVQLQLTDRAINLVEEAYDLGIRFGELPDTRLTARRIMSNRRFLCAAPAYLKKHGTPAVPADLTRHACILHRQNDDAYATWRLTKGRRGETVKVRGRLSSNDGDVVLGWALDGHGILPRSEWDAAKYLESGRLQVVLPDYQLPPADLYAYYPSREHQAAKVRAFIDFLVAAFAA